MLAAAHPDASGMAGADGMESPENVIVTVVTEEDREEEARSLLEWAGGRLWKERAFRGEKNDV